MKIIDNNKVNEYLNEYETDFLIDLCIDIIQELEKRGISIFQVSSFNY